VSGLDALFVGAHPDDVELTSGGLAALLASHGHRVGILDLTRGEAGSRGTIEERAREAEEAARALGVAARECLRLPDLGIDRSSREQQIAMVALLRRLRPGLVVAPDRDDEHPDHVEGSHLVERACYLAGLARFEAPGERHRPGRLLFALYRTGARPHLVVDVSRAWERRTAALRAHRSQLDPVAGPSTYLTEPDFIAAVEARARHWGALIGASHGEAYRARGPVAIADGRTLLPGAHALAGGTR
jgi:bacillithiol biosynthesis deacetylase BshB1